MPTINVPGIGDVFADGFAEEQTMQRILQALSDSNNVNSADAQQRLRESAITTANSTTALGQTLRKTGQETETAGSQTAKGLKDAATSGSTFANIIGRSQRSLAQAFRGVTGDRGGFGPLAFFSDLLEGAGKGLTQLGTVLPGLGKAFSYLAGPLFTALGAAGGFLVTKLQQVDKQFTEFQNAGGLLGGSFMDLRVTAQASGLTVGQFNNIVKNSTEQLASFGGTTRMGAREFARATGRLRSEFGPQLMAMGLNFEDMGNATADLLQSFTFAGVAIQDVGIGTQAFAEATRNAVAQQKIMSVLTGRSIEQQRQAERQTRRDAQVQSAMRNLDGETRKALETFIANQPQFRDVILDQITFGRITSKNAAMLSGIAPETVRAVQQTVDGVMNTSIKAPSEFFARLSRNSEQIANEMDTQGLLTDLSRFTNNELTTLARDTFTQQQQLVAAAINRTIANVAQDFEKLTGEMDPLTKSVFELRNATQNLQVEFASSINGFLNSSKLGVDAITGGINAIQNALRGINNFIGTPRGTRIGDGSDVVFGEVRTRRFTPVTADPTGNVGGDTSPDNTSTTTNTGTTAPLTTNTVRPNGTNENPLVVKDPTMHNMITELVKATKNTATGLDNLKANLT